MTTANELIAKIYGAGGQGAVSPYLDTVNRGYESLGQPYQDTKRTVNGTIVGDRAGITTEFITNLASRFADRVYQKTGTLPTEDQVRQFVAQSANAGTAAKFATGSLGGDMMTALADEYLMGNPDALSVPGQKNPEEERLAGLSGQIDKLYGLGKESLVKGYDESVYGPGKTRAVNDLAGQGMLTQPTSRYILNEIEANRGRDLSSGLANLETERAKGNIDISKSIEDIIQRNKDRSQDAYKFNKTFSANRDDNAFDQGIQRRGLDIAAQIGRLQAGQKSNGLSGAAGGALSGAATGGALTKNPWGAGIGALLGGGLGYFGTRG